MSVVKLIDDYLIEFGNERFLEGWNGQQERIIKLLESFDPRTAIGDLLPLLIKGENK